MNERIHWGRKMTAKLHHAERDADQHLARLGELLAELPAARAQGGVGAELAQGILENLGQAVTGAIGSRALVVQMHRSMAQVGEQTGAYIPTTGGFGDGGEKPLDHPKGLSVVASRAA